MHLIAFTFSCLMLVVSVKAQYEKLFTSGPAFANYPYPTIPLNCSEIGPSGSTLGVDHMEGGAGFFPALEWPSPSNNIREYVLVSEDPDAPFPHSVIHGLYYGIPRVFTGLEHADFQVSGKHNDSYLLEGGFKYGQNRRDTVYLPPRSMPGQGPHRYFFELIALSDPIDRSRLSDRATLEEIAVAIHGRVVGWGAWVGVVKNK
ncbi:YbhB/YbcL family Raf kinase inhibitor-like protein [Aspergillus thermomutatus]|uniref:PEBP-like protein n=1 Tax=Aspergillus thermomutatus TaxID=41047 RepID=A0A397H190_ASPTH|nr:uncharacterized protein CDV56_104190 [Aspergillus thermomutatus]RHZ54140.1 hypothetical protein CDV56_104190 [Aspergillus thermomutatus]